VPPIKILYLPKIIRSGDPQSKKINTNEQTNVDPEEKSS
jgi:hypothetical protein